ncbi:MAG: hypothetical protein Q7J80_04105 [Anaerolineales bacterium]|nr:hypothetical protein [Anaerolineales bacterium]
MMHQLIATHLKHVTLSGMVLLGPVWLRGLLWPREHSSLRASDIEPIIFMEWKR